MSAGENFLSIYLDSFPCFNFKVTLLNFSLGYIRSFPIVHLKTIVYY